MEQTALQVQEVDFQGATLLAVKDLKNQVWAGVKWVCQGIGLSEGQRQRQTTNMQSDLVLKQGVANLQLPTKGGNQAVLCIMIDYLPLWLAKISITPAMQKETPELVKKLIAYQLKAKDVLTAAFLPKEYTNSIPYSQAEFNAVKLALQDQSKQQKELASNISFIKHEIFKMVYAPSNSEWKRSVNAKILEVNKVTKISCTSLLNNIYIQMRENGCNLIELAHRYEFENGLTQCPIIEYIDKHEDQKRQFEILLDELVSRTFPIKALNHSNVEVSQKYLNVQQEKEKSEVLEAPIEKPIATDIVKTTIQPLIEKYMDSSKGGHATYRKVYTAMGVCWVNRQTRYKNEYHLKNAPKKSTLIKKDEKLMKLFVDTVNNLMAN